MNFYNNEIEEVLEKLKTTKLGLTEEEAHKRKKKNGPNKLKEAKKEIKLLKFFNQFKNLMIIVLLIAAIISFIISYLNKECIKLVNKRIPVSLIADTGVFDLLIKIKYDVPNDDIGMLDGYPAKID